MDYLRVKLSPAVQYLQSATIPMLDYGTILAWPRNRLDTAVR